MIEVRAYEVQYIPLYVKCAHIALEGSIRPRSDDTHAAALRYPHCVVAGAPPITIDLGVGICLSLYRPKVQREVLPSLYRYLMNTNIVVETQISHEYVVFK